MRRDLEAAGADTPTLEAVDAVVGRGEHAGGETVAVVAARGQILLHEHLPEPPQHSRGRYDPLPWLLPLLEVRQSEVPHVVVLADRVGADVVGIAAGDTELERSVDGDTEHIHRGAPGGWSQRRFQERAENTWEDDARFRDGLGTDLAVEGPARTLEFCARAVVDTLLVHDDPDDERTAWFGPEPVQVGLDRDTVAAIGVDDPQEGRLTDVAARAAIGTSADVHVVPDAGGPDGGLGAVLRHRGTTPDRPA